MKKINFHTHTYRCQHAGGTELDYIDRAHSLGFDRIGLSDHGPYPDHDFGLRMDISELDDYIAGINAGKEKYLGSMEVYSGLEIEYLAEYREYYESLLTDRGLDYLILGQHFYRVGDDLPNIFFPQNTDTYVDYAKSIAEALDTGIYTMLAHPDLYTLGEFAWDINCDRARDLILDAAVKHDTILEYNANGLRRGLKVYPDGERFMYPHDRFWKEVSGTGLRVVVGSDAHDPEFLWDTAVEASYINLEKYGITPYDFYK